MTAENNRRAWMSLLAKAPADRLSALWQAYGAAPKFHWLRAPEIGASMVRGRLGGTGAPFNLGEMTLTRCALQLESGEVGHGYVQGRDKQKAEIAALVDALMQGPEAAAVEAAVLEPLGAEMAEVKTARAEKAAATKVDFFTMVRGED
ncbi:MAG: phosphonate C-P lyase system protein PhnG [Shimia sp.]|uniref:phosphonate C-P lyase system protein PhnG n=1 Tax=Shimia sp. TaxID=1954381 RepID=UPI003B8E3013